jgi:hypothetical protein
LNPDPIGIRNPGFFHPESRVKKDTGSRVRKLTLDPGSATMNLNIFYPKYFNKALGPEFLLSCNPDPGIKKALIPDPEH